MVMLANKSHLVTVTRECFPPNNWNTEVGNATLWQGTGIDVLIKLQERFGFKYNFISPGDEGKTISEEARKCANVEAPKINN